MAQTRRRRRESVKKTTAPLCMHLADFFWAARHRNMVYEPAHLSRRRHRRAQHYGVDLRSYLYIPAMLVPLLLATGASAQSSSSVRVRVPPAGQGAVLTGTATTSSSILISKRHGDARLRFHLPIVDARSTAVDGGANSISTAVYITGGSSAPRLEFADNVTGHTIYIEKPLGQRVLRIHGCDATSGEGTCVVADNGRRACGSRPFSHPGQHNRDVHNVSGRGYQQHLWHHGPLLELGWHALPTARDPTKWYGRVLRPTFRRLQPRDPTGAVVLSRYRGHVGECGQLERQSRSGGVRLEEARAVRWRRVGCC